MIVRRRLFAGPVLLLLLLAACGGEDAPAVAPAVTSAIAPAPPRDPDLLSDVWYSQVVDGQKAGWLHVVWRRGTRDGEPVVTDRTEVFEVSTRDMAGTIDRFTVRTVIEVTRNATGELLDLHSVRTEPGRRVEGRQTFTGDGYDWVEEVPGHRETRRVDCDEPCPTDTEAFLSARAARGEIHPGQALSFPVPNFLTGEIDTVELAVEATETLALATGPASCWRVVESVKGRPGRTTVWIDRAGVMRRVRDEGGEIVSTTEERARRLPAGGYRFAITVPAEPSLPRVTSATEATIEVTLAEKEGVELPDFPESAFSREIGRDGNRIRLRLTAHDDPEATVELPVADAALARFLEPTNLLSSDAEVVRKAATGAVAGATDGREAARRLLRFVFLALRKESGPSASPSAAEILEEGRGDCSEHAVLFVALCRAVGLPARLVSGYAEVGDEWGSHLFTEIWLGRWIGADPSTNELGTRARYIAFGRSDEPDSYPGLVSARIQGRIRIRTLTFTDAGETVDLAAPPEPAPRNDLRSGLAFAEPPEGWEVRMGPEPGAATVRGPDFGALVSVVSGMGELDAEMLRRFALPGGEPVRFAGVDALRTDEGWGRLSFVTILVPYRRRLLQISLEAREGELPTDALATLERLLEPTLAPVGAERR